MKFGKNHDYKIAYCPNWNCVDPIVRTNLVEGVNTVAAGDPEYKYVVKLEELSTKDINLSKHGNKSATKIRITHLNKTHNQGSQGFTLVYKILKEGVDLTNIVAGITLTANNNSHCGYGLNFNDGDTSDVFAKPGEQKLMVVNPEKYIYSSDIGKCRDISYNEEIFRKTTETMKKKCGKLCKPKKYWTCIHDIKNHSIPECKTKAEETCFDEIEEMQADKVLKKACTKLQYSNTLVRSTFKYFFNKISFKVNFPNPPETVVKEEYLLFDLISMIGAVGGTLGLCIGFSFMEVAGSIMELLEIGVKKM